MGPFSLLGPHSHEVIGAVIDANAGTVIFARNRPFREPEPRAKYAELTQWLAEVLDFIDTCVVDHIVVGGTRTIGLQERGMA